MLGSAVSSSTPNDFQPSSHMGQRGSCPLMKSQALPGPAIGCAYDAVGMQRAFDSAIGLPSRSTSAAWMLAFLMPAEVRRSLMLPPGSLQTRNRLGAYGSVRGRDLQTTENSSAPSRNSSWWQRSLP